jgi:ribonuclease Z
MHPSFHPRLVNGPFDDPGLYIAFQFQNRAILFDLGDITSLSARDILKISHVFVTHTHMDHFIGFDHLLRLVLGRDKDLHFYGPSGFIANVAGKLAGYTWNLLHNYENRLTLHLHEILPRKILTTRVSLHERFQIHDTPDQRPASGAVHSEPALSVEAIRIEHDIACLGLRLKERFHVNIRKVRLEKLGLQTGPWLQRFKEALYEGQDRESEFVAGGHGASGTVRSFALGELAQKIAIITPGQKISYITDTDGSAENIDRIVEFVRDSDHLFIEAAFLDEDRRIASRKHHLTARQAGCIAGRANVRQYSLFHYSPRYQGLASQIEAEAREAYEMCKPR